MSTAPASGGGFILKLRSAPPERVDLSALVPGRLAHLSTGEIEKLQVNTGPQALHVADLFTVSGSAGPALTFEGGSSLLDNVASEHAGGLITVDGDVGAYAGHKMRAGKLAISGHAGPALGCQLQGGLITLGGDAGDCLGAPRAGEKDGIAGGVIVVHGAAGDNCATRMRRGIVIVRGAVGAFAGARMMGGTIWTLTGFGSSAGVQMRRGTLITPKLDNPLPTFLDCGRHDLGILQIMARHLKATYGEEFPALPTGPMRRFAGDMAHLGKGEILSQT